MKFRTIAGRPYSEPISSVEVDQAERRMDEPHDGVFLFQRALEVLVAIMLVLAVVGLFFVAGCDAAEFERIRARAELNERIRIAVVPERDSFVMCAWRGGNLICKHYTPTARYKRDEPHVEVKGGVIATEEEFQE